MSDTSPPPPPPSGGFSADPKQAKAQAKASKAHAKALRPWFKKKRFIIPLVLVAIIGISVAAGGGGDDDKSPTAASDDGTGTTDDGGGENETLFPGRPDAQKEDQERNIGGSVELWATRPQSPQPRSSRR